MNEKMDMKYAPFLFFLVRGEEKNAGKVWRVNKKPYLCIVKNKTGGFVERLDYGVMVTQQILVLFFQVRVLVVQRKFRLKLKSSIFAASKTERVVLLKDWTMV